MGVGAAAAQVQVALELALVQLMVLPPQAVFELVLMQMP